MTTALIFPGQGSQAVGMGQALVNDFQVARDVFAEVDEALGQNLSALIWAGPAEELTLTSNTQPALMATSMAVLRVLEAEKDLKVSSAAFVAGHSLGEYVALCAAGALGLADTAKLLRIRGDAMQAAVPVGAGAMAAILGLDLKAVEQVIDEASSAGECEIANDNAPGQVVVSGHLAAVERVITAAKEAGAKRALPLPVSAPFHCKLMQPAADKMAEALAAVSVKMPVVPVMANVTAAPVTSPEAIRDLLVKQVTGRVRWTESIQAMGAAGVTSYIEIGAGKVLSGLVKRIDKSSTTQSIATPEDVAGVSV